MNPLVNVIPTRFRKYVYAAFALAVIVTQSLDKGGLDIGNTNEVLVYLGGALGLVAASNATDRPPLSE